MLPQMYKLIHQEKMHLTAILKMDKIVITIIYMNAILKMDTTAQPTMK
jgi:hypothetical protein